LLGDQTARVAGLLAARRLDARMGIVATMPARMVDVGRPPAVVLAFRGPK
jgi:hypothetical protein